jgi:hypothetical protein
VLKQLSAARHIFLQNHRTYERTRHLYRVDGISVLLLLLWSVCASLRRRRNVPGLGSNEIEQRALYLTHNMLHLLVHFSEGGCDDDDETRKTAW